MVALCFSCDRRKQKYTTGLCEPCHRIAVEADHASQSRARTPLPARSSKRLRASRRRPKPDILTRTALHAAKRKQRTDKQIVAAYRNALINIWKLAAVSYDGRRKCHDSQFVASMVIAKCEPELFQKLDELHYKNVTINRKGRISVNFAGPKVQSRRD